MDQIVVWLKRQAKHGFSAVSVLWLRKGINSGVSSSSASWYAAATGSQRSTAPSNCTINSAHTLCRQRLVPKLSECQDNVIFPQMTLVWTHYTPMTTLGQMHTDNLWSMQKLHHSNTIKLTLSKSSGHPVHQRVNWKNKVLIWIIIYWFVSIPCFHLL